MIVYVISFKTQKVQEILFHRANSIKSGFRISGFMRRSRGNKDFMSCFSELSTYVVQY